MVLVAGFSTFARPSSPVKRDPVVNAQRCWREPPWCEWYLPCVCSVYAHWTTNLLKLFFIYKNACKSHLPCLLLCGTTLLNLLIVWSPATRFWVHRSSSWIDFRFFGTGHQMHRVHLKVKAIQSLGSCEFWPWGRHLYTLKAFELALLRRMKMSAKRICWVWWRIQRIV